MAGLLRIQRTCGGWLGGLVTPERLVRVIHLVSVRGSDNRPSSLSKKLY